MNDRAANGRLVGLLIVAFVATFVLLAGGWALLGAASRAPRASAAAFPPSGAPAASSSASPSQPFSFAPAPSGEPPVFVLTGAGDIADCSLPGAQQTSDLLLKEHGAVFTAGDNAYPDGSLVDFANCYEPTWGRVRDRTLLPAAGNHDWNTADARGYRNYFGAAAAPQGVTWYSMDLGTWHVVVLDSDCDQVGGCGPASPQGEWLAHDLAASTAHCTLAIWHHPRFSSGEHGNDPGVAPFWNALYAANAELVVNGHDHDYERFAPQDPAGVETRPRGLREFVVGTGGAVLRQFQRKAPNSEFRHASVYGVLRLTLHPANYDWEFLPVEGEIADAGSALCH
jgi:hypothetical protein